MSGQRHLSAGIFPFAFCLVTLLTSLGWAQFPEPAIPEPLRPWKDWVLWDSPQLTSPLLYDSAEQRILIWPSTLELNLNSTGGAWKLQVQAFSPTWLSLPGSEECWPQAVQLDNQIVPVVSRNGIPSIFLATGLHAVAGSFAWQEQPEKIAIPSEIGILALTLDGQSIPLPNRDTSGWLWLRRSQASAEEKDQLSLQVYRVLEDGLPMWLRTELEVSVSGKSREEDLGFVLPANWQLSFVNSPIPVALDEAGRIKAQVRAGNWKIRIDAFRNEDLRQLEYAAATPPAVAMELVALRARPELRAIELQNATPIDVSLTTFPEDWRNLPVFQWDTTAPLPWTVKSSGAGELRPNRFQITRQLWLDDDGRGLTYQDSISGESRQISRLDVAPSHELAVMRIDGTRQLITRNPETAAEGVELRTRYASIEAIGRATQPSQLAATGWQANADSLLVSFWLPPGWRMLALFGADRVEGDWLTAWTLLDLFLLLIFSLAIFRMWGLTAGVIAFLAFGLAYHEAGAPRFTWLFLLIPVAILQVVRPGRLHKWLSAWRYLALVLLLLFLTPFLAREIQSALYPQLEPAGIQYRERNLIELFEGALPRSRSVAREYTDAAPGYLPPVSGNSLDNRPQSMESGRLDSGKAAKSQGQQAQSSNMFFDPGTSIQTGIAKPEWEGNLVECFWDGPVNSEQTIRPILLTATQHRLLTVGRIVLLCLLLGLFLRPQAGKKRSRPAPAPAAGLVLLCSLLIGAAPVAAQDLPDRDLLNSLCERLLKPSDAFPQAAEIPMLRATIRDGKLLLEGQIHAAAECAVPLPGQFPSWSPLSVRLGDSAGIVCRRDDGYLWLWVPEGVHPFRVEGLLPDAAEWVWSFQLTPRQLELDASDWNVTGLRPDGRPENQLFFSRKERAAEGDSRYDQRNFRAIVQVDRMLEIGLVWKVHNTVRRLSSPGRAITVQVPLLAGERVLSGNVTPEDGMIEVNLSAEAGEFSWESELPLTPEIQLAAKPQPQTVERWSLLTSPVWNIRPTGPQPIYESESSELIPVWYPWPGEEVKLALQRPVAVEGKTLTVQSVEQSLDVGNRQRNSRLRFKVESSLGNDFAVELPEGAEVRELQLNNRSLPIRREGKRILIGLQPGAQEVELEWTATEAIGTQVTFPAVSLPVEAANVTSVMNVPESRWILWTRGPLRGPAVQFWVVLLLAGLIGWALSRHPLSPLRGYEWVLLAIGLTQVHFLAGLLVPAWLLLLARRGKREPNAQHWLAFNFAQLGLVLLTIIALSILVYVVSRGLLGQPEMFIRGNGSHAGRLVWFTPASGNELTRPEIISISIWFYRLLMLVWALWLANAVIRWLQIGWQNFTAGGAWRTNRLKEEEKEEEALTEAQRHGEQSR
ncbi:MAG: hypothetical protein ACK6CE_13525 [Planctomycetota bacterium]